VGTTKAVTASPQRSWGKSDNGEFADVGVVEQRRFDFLCRDVLETGKEAYYAQRDMTVEHASSYLAEMLALLMESEDHAEGVRAFVEDRDPEWRVR